MRLYKNLQELTIISRVAFKSERKLTKDGYLERIHVREPMKTC